MTSQNGAMANPLVSRLSMFNRLSDGDEAAIGLACSRTRTLGPRQEIIGAGEKPRCVYVALAGWAARYSTLEDGRRQIAAFLLPGDLFDLNLFLLKRMDHSIETITRATVAELNRERFEALTDRHPRITKALMWHQLVLMAIEREWVVNVGQRSGYERLAHLLTELYLRLTPVGEIENGCCAFPLTQADLAEATGMTVVHVNRMLQQLRSDGLVTLAERKLCIPDLHALMEAGLFNIDYLHMAEADILAAAE